MQGMGVPTVLCPCQGVLKRVERGARKTPATKEAPVDTAPTTKRQLFRSRMQVGIVWMGRSETMPAPLPALEVHCFECGSYVWPRRLRRCLRRQHAVLRPGCEYLVCRLFHRLRSV